jgi:hypothetical protein
MLLQTSPNNLLDLEKYAFLSKTQNLKNVKDLLSSALFVFAILSVAYSLKRIDRR